MVSIRRACIGELVWHMLEDVAVRFICTWEKNEVYVDKNQRLFAVTLQLI
jgi:hypothetical protein